MKKVLCILSAVIISLCAAGVSYAMCGTCEAAEEHGSEGMAASTEEMAAVNVGNKVCPVSGDVIDEATKATVEHEGKVYNLCCPVCVEPFKSDPAKYIDKVHEEMSGQE